MPPRAPDTEARFDAQAAAFGERAGLPGDVKRRVAHAVAAFASAGKTLETRKIPPTVLDVGAGTGEVGLELVSVGVRYVGVDSSSRMLDVFRDRARPLGHDPRLIAADASLPWPVEDASIDLVFGSRSLHWLAPAHVAAEWARVAAPPGAPLLIGRVKRDREGPREQIREYMRACLREAGFAPRGAGANARGLVEVCASGGARPLERVTVAEWTVLRAPRAALDDWRSKDGLAGIALAEDDKARILDDVERWTRATFGNIDESRPSRERYTLEGVLPVGFPETALPNP